MHQLGTTAVEQRRYPGLMLFDIEIGVSGLNQFFAARAGIETVAGTISSKTKADYYPGALPIRIKIVVEKESERVIGGQIIGGEAVTQRVNALSFAIQKQMTVRELAKADTAYAPPVNETWEPMILAAEMANRKL